MTLVRFFGWAMLWGVAVFLVNNILVVWHDFPALSVGPGDDWRTGFMAGLYLLALAGAGYLALRPTTTSLRHDARLISDFNAYIIRACFYAILFVGIADVVVSFLRVERLLTVLFPEPVARGMIRAQYLGTWVHAPLIIAGFVIALLYRHTLGFPWLTLLIVVAELLIVFSRFVFSYEQALMGDLVRYWYAALFLFSSAYTLLEEGHVRVDVLYAGFDTRRKGRANAIGSILFGMTTCWTIILVGMGSAQAIINSPVRNFEVSQTGTSGMFIKYQMAAFLGVFAVTMLIQFVSSLFDSVADARGEPGGREPAPVSH